jgi:aminopeptidase N
LGPFPFPSLSVARLPVPGGGIEYPGAIQLFDDSRLVTVHETAHQYFYAMVGDSQAQHPWLDEAFATFLEQLVDGTAEPAKVLHVPGRVDSPISAFNGDDVRYDTVVYGKGAAALEAARRAIGAARFDAALRCYVAANAWRIAVPADFERAIAAYPSGVGVLRAAGAFE